jgi:hypothetical protein
VQAPVALAATLPPEARRLHVTASPSASNTLTVIVAVPPVLPHRV